MMACPKDGCRSSGMPDSHSAVCWALWVFAHHPALFTGILLLFSRLPALYPQHQDRLILREALMVGFFLAGLVVLGGMQQWWLQPLLLKMSPDQPYFGATALTAITDNAALTYLGFAGVGPDARVLAYMLVAGAVTGGGLTVIANAPNPLAGYAILQGSLMTSTSARSVCWLQRLGRRSLHHLLLRCPEVIALRYPIPAVPPAICA